MKAESSVELHVLHLLKSLLHHPRLDPSTRLLEDGILDSLGFVDLIMCIEQDFGVTIGITETDLEIFATPASIARHVNQLRTNVQMNTAER